ncbi:MAG: hypothetical protein WA889_00145 [Xanthobacteraceae bacterium]
MPASSNIRASSPWAAEEWFYGGSAPCKLRLCFRPQSLAAGGEVSEETEPIRLTDEQRLDWLRLIRSQNVGPRGIRQQTHLSTRGCRWVNFS